MGNVPKELTNTVAKSYYIPFCGSNDKKSRQIYDGISQVMDQLKHRMNLKKKHISSRKFIHIFYPLIVFDGLIFSADVLNNKIILKRVNQVRVQVGQEDSGKHNYYSIDVVTKGELVRYIQTVKKDSLILKEFFKKVIR